MSDKFDTTASRWAHQGFKYSDYAQLKEKLERTQLECERIRAYAIRLDEEMQHQEMQHQAKLEMEARAERDEALSELNAGREEVGRLMSHNAGLSEALYRARAECERLQLTHSDR